MYSNFVKWLDERLMVTPLWRDMADHPVPEQANPSERVSAFVYCFGGVTFLLIISQFITGMFLALYYVPDIVNSYNSTKYIMTHVTFGSWLISMHNWGSSLIIIMVTLHMLRIYWMGVYKKPREGNWIIGVTLLLLILAFGFTGYLLPWDEKAYFATQVGVSFLKYVPFIGNALVKILQGGNSIGADTLTHFFALHVLFLPALLLTFLAFHFMLIRRHGISGPY
ncbi:menaquinol:cytochrome c oxidoreductase (cytochrome b subunit) [Candidatus Hydrogenisulfobacillus filiaventi]|uniref:Menaquinol:cytochrome c oxidoreductase (Cytochrome b subunit) n=1 Tax=Candidatus Hydrogenisulfobacillus filiaventi TaxID=2707344 RepID=A0A6F8ZF61_9FIRM|nr:cytochrome b N-terminal domain-containing protein [Bacillota bacterium]CAB1128508.1 menaquinol:cytochrome c oxidoreductase (cytochrome b subunit) [Candidatus Hydrogenisulfobacillus filiaventi]